MFIPEFKSFGKITRYENKVHLRITQKMHGTNAQICIFNNPDLVDPNCITNPQPFDILVGSRNRWITPENDNFGFAQWCYTHKDFLIKLLGEGRHYGEWCGPGINSGEGLTEKTLFLFNKQIDICALPIRTVPTLFDNEVPYNLINTIVSMKMDDLKNKGSEAVPGFMTPEGVVIEINGKRFKQVFEQEEVAWKPKKVVKTSTKGNTKVNIDVSYLLQPKRLEKLLSRDELYLQNYPHTLSTIVADYVKDLEEENQLPVDKDQLRMVKKSLGRAVFNFVKQFIGENYVNR